MNRKLLAFLLILCLSLIVFQGYSQTINFPGGRIAFSSDGNQHDKDDWGASALALAMLKYADLDSLMVHYDHSDHMGDNNTNYEAQMIESVRGGAQRFGLDVSKVFNDQREVEAAVANFREEALKCTAGDPLWFICAGPMEVPYRCLAAVPDSQLKYIHCISHSSWNEKHNDALNDHTWADMKADFPSVTYHDIIDQNGSNGDYDFNSPESYWYWLRDSDDPDWEWLFSRNDKNSFDVSDAGMTWWLITGGPGGGQDDGGWRETRALFEKNQVIPEPDADSSLVALYHFEGDVGDEMEKYNGTGYGGPVFGSGQSGMALQFDGVDDYVSILRPVKDNFTICFWIKTTSTGAGDGQWWTGSGLVDGEVGGVKDDFGSSILSTGKLAFGVGNSDKTIVTTVAVNDGKWHHIALTRRAANGAMKIYLDGELNATGTGPTGTKSAPASLHFGNLQTDIRFFSGMLDEVAIYNYVLQADAVRKAWEGNLVMENLASLRPGSLRVYPNPSNGSFMMDLESITGEAGIRIIDLNGRVRYESTVQGGGMSDISAELQAGIYLIKILAGSELFINRISIQK